MVVAVNRRRQAVVALRVNRVVASVAVNHVGLVGTEDNIILRIALNCDTLLNRRGVDLAISEHFEENAEMPYVLALMDVDDFKMINDRYGHSVGDEVLRSFSDVVSKALSEDAILGRNGGDEFVAMLFGEDAERADEIFEQLVRMEHGCEFDGRWYPASLSIGYVGYPEQVRTLKTAYTRADQALYAVKLSGKADRRRYFPEIESQYRTLLGFSSRDLAENIPGGIMVHKATGSREILFANEEIIHMLGCESLPDFMHFTGGTFDGLALPEDLPRVRAALEEKASNESGEDKGFTNYRIRTKSGGARNVAASSRLVEMEGLGKVFYVILIDRDERQR